jgi:hypothetical protein
VSDETKKAYTPIGIGLPRFLVQPKRQNRALEINGISVLAYSLGPHCAPCHS